MEFLSTDELAHLPMHEFKMLKGFCQAFLDESSAMRDSILALMAPCLDPEHLSIRKATSQEIEDFERNAREGAMWHRLPEEIVDYFCDNTRSLAVSTIQ